MKFYEANAVPLGLLNLLNGLCLGKEMKVVFSLMTHCNSVEVISTLIMAGMAVFNVAGDLK